MHELSIAYNLVTLADDAAKQAGVSHVDIVHLRLGVLSGVVKDALLFSYDIATGGTCLDGSKLVIEMVPATIYCDVCEQDAQLDDIQNFCCPLCNTPTANIRQGREIELVSLEINDESEEKQPL